MKKHRQGGSIIIWIVAVVAVITGIFWTWRMYSDNNRPKETSSNTTNKKESVPKKSFPLINLQPTVNTWAAQQTGIASVVIYDLANRQTVASLNPDRQYFSASIYKLYVAYIGYQKVADGTYKMNESYLNGKTRGECLDAMIRSSDIPCGEKMATELGSSQIMGKLNSYGLKNTVFSGAYATTSAQDVAIVLQRLFENRELNNSHTELLLDSMKDQPALYRRGLPSGFSRATVYDKVGWNLLKEWHDTAIITLPNSRSYVVTVFTENVGMNQIKALGQAIEKRLTE